MTKIFSILTNQTKKNELLKVGNINNLPKNDELFNNHNDQDKKILYAVLN